MQRTLSIFTSAMLLGSALTASAASIMVTEPNCADLQAQLKRSRYGTSSYQRTLETIRQNCQTIRPGCPSEAALQTAEKRCKDAELSAMRYKDASQCTQVSCSEKAPFSSSSSAISEDSSSSKGICPTGDDLFKQAVICKNAQKKFNNLVDENGCRVIQCIDSVPGQTSCPAPDTLQKKAAECASIGQKYEYVTEGLCKKIRCYNDAVITPEVSCPTNEALNSTGFACRRKGLAGKIVVDKNGCRSVQCTSPLPQTVLTCPTNQELDAAIKVCKASGLGYSSMPDETGCRQVTCSSAETGIDTGGMTPLPSNNRCSQYPNALICRHRSAR